MQIEITNGGKRYNREWIFKGLSYTFKPDEPVAVVGSNGSGKSTLLLTLSTRAMLSEGEVTFTLNGKPVASEHRYKQVAMAAPYLELIEEYTLAEMVAFHQEHKAFIGNLSVKDVITEMELRSSTDKPLRYFSSGMKQRVKLALAILSQSRVLLLDEPASNLDHKAMQWYRQLMETYSRGRVVIVCSNHQPVEYDFCRQQIVMEHFKPAKGIG